MLLVFVMPSNILALGVPLFGLFNPEGGLELRLLVEHDYWDAMRWLAGHGESEDVVLSSPNIGLWIPAWSDKHVVYGHPFETLDAAAKFSQIEAWYQGEDCETVFDHYDIRYVVVGPQERAITAGVDGGDTCYAGLAQDSLQVHQFGDVTVYEVGGQG